MKLALPRLVPRGRIPAVMRRLAKAIDGLDEPAVEKIAQEQKEDAFQVLIATMLSAQTRDAVTADASRRLFRVARSPKTMARLSVKEIERLIYPVSFYRNKAVHVKRTCEMIVSRFGGRVPGTMEELRGSMGERDLVRLAGTFDPDVVRQATGALSDVEVVAASEDQVALAVPEASRRLPELLAAVTATGAEVRETTVTRPSLESLFIRLTGKELRE